MTFTTRTLGEICDEGGGEVRTGPFGSQLHESDYVDEGVPVVMPKNISGGGIDTNGIARIREEDAERLRQHRLSPGDIVYGRRGDIGRHAFVTSREAGWLCGTGCLRITLGNKADVSSLFLHYSLDQVPTIGWIRNQAIGATMPNLNTSILRSVPISYPPLPTQWKIAAALSAYDDLIRNNMQRIAILENMARSLFQEWFVKFRFPGYDRARLVDSELGGIPWGWAVRKLADVMTLKYGKH